MNRSLLAVIVSISFIAGAGTTFAQSSTEWHKQGVKFLQLSNPDYDKAIYAFTRAIELNPEDIGSYFGRAVCYSVLSKFPEAIRDLTKVIELDPSLGNAYYSRGQLYHASGDIQRATADYISAARLGDKSAQKILTKAGIRW